MTYNNKVSIAAVLTFLTFFFGCFLGGEDIKQNSTGNSGEVVVVMDSSLWTSDAGDQLLNCLSRPQDGLPQSEPIFNVISVTPRDFKQIFKVTRNIIIVEKEKSTKKASYVLKENLWANNQLVLVIKANSNQQAAEILSKNCEGIADRFREEEWRRLQTAFGKLRNAELSSKVKSRIGIDPLIPNDFVLAKELDDLVWIRKDYDHKGHQVSMGMLFYKIPYDSVGSLETVNILAERNERVKWVEGPNEGSFMSTYEEYPPAEKELGFEKKYVKELRGLWNMKGAFMGGPFVHYSFVDAEGRYLVNIDAYVFAPKFDKREYLRELEAIALSSLRSN